MNEALLTEAARKARNAYHREWRRKNPEKMAEYCAKHWEKKAREAERGESNNQGESLNGMAEAVRNAGYHNVQETAK